MRLTADLALVLVFLLALAPASALAQGSRRDSSREFEIDPLTELPSAQAAWHSPSREPAAVREGINKRRYSVLPGDTLWSIAGHFGVGADVVTSTNGLTGSAPIQNGMDLLIPYSNEAGTAVAGPDAPVVPAPGWHFVASMTQQSCWLFKDGVVAYQWPCSTGREASASVPGNYTVKSKEPVAYSLPVGGYLPYWLGIYDAGILENGIHGFPYSADTGEKMWTDQIGMPVTFGCIMLDDRAARTLYELSYIGMPVTILP